jgi:peptide/nickel transport system permease protein
MLNDAQTLTALAPNLAVIPGLAVLLFVLGLNLLGEGLRQRTTPTMDPDLETMTNELER